MMHPFLPAIPLGFIALTAPWMLLGGLLVGLPVIAHLLNRRTTRKLIFPNLELLIASAASQSGLFRFRRLLLLFLRVLVVLLIVLAFAMPVFSKGSNKSATKGDGQLIVIVIDRSLSTHMLSGSVTAIESLRAQADQVLSQLSSKDRVNIVYADGHPTQALPAMTANVGLLRSELGPIEPTQQRADISAALALAAEILNKEGGSRAPRLVVLSDLQQSNWADVDIASSLTALPKGTQVTLMPMDGDTAENVTAHQLKISPATPVIGQRVSLRGQLTSYADSPRDVEVSLHLDDELIDRQRLSVDPWQQREFTFSCVFEQLGDTRVEVRISDDALEDDNTARLVVRVHQRVPVVVLSDHDPEEAGTDSFFLMRAVAPRDGGADRYEARHLASQDTITGQLDGAAAVLIGDVQRLRRSMLTALQQHMASGGGVVLFCNEAPVAELIAQLIDTPGGGTLPWVSMRRRDLNALGEWATLGEADWRSLFLRDFDLASQQALGEIAFRQIWAVESVHPNTRILMRFDDGTPAIGLMPIGQGQLMICNFSPSLASSDLGKYGSFIALIQSMIHSLSPPFSGSLSRHSGDALTFNNIAGYNPSGGPLQVLDGAGQPINDAVFHTLGGQPIASIHRADRAGFYEVRQDGKRLALRAIDVDPREGETRRIDADVLALQFTQAGIDAQNVAAVDGGHTLTGGGRPLWGWMIVLAMMAMSVEMLALGCFRWGGRR